ncbi:hypothetical protein A2393_02380 [Candidatus Woesebacteria bacterium RIFOXYB1_FULL_41_13]|uniref:Glycosyltransferase 2-like domain-containing protein n=1 Tax=Candidatus Woesebacteria bacterium RIFOXYB1_FULL_41_13 TaxID=1802540 RepID=A0A1F8D056_9BACT|nr:MAG: hypothetical protein A2393_02380 [Candidatus Woesebacteria bacterium RIFOXYB1_FULL_41_13]
MKPIISVVIPSFNKAKYIGKTLDSIIKQEYPNLEVIIMDGGSTDGTLKVIEKYAHKYPEFIKYQSKNDKGQMDAVNKGFNKAKGKILTYINADDIYKAGAFAEIEKMYRLNIDALWFAGRGMVIDGKGDRIAVWPNRYKNLLLAINSYPLLLIVNYLMQPSVFITRTAWKRFGPFVGTKKFITEYELWLKIAEVRMPIVTNKYLSSFRIEPSTITKKFTRLLLQEDEKIVKRYTSSNLIIFLHNLHNIGRLVVGKIV